MPSPRKPLFTLKRPGTESRSPVTGWHAVEIQCERDACGAARAEKGQRYLAAEAPLLPLPKCDRRRDCNCRYRHFADRREGPRRSAEGAPPAQQAADQADRRYMEGRRVDDVDPDIWQGAETESSLDDTYFNYVNRAKLTDRS